MTLKAPVEDHWNLPAINFEYAAKRLLPPKRRLSTIEERSVSFRPRISIQAIPNLQSYSREDAQNIWYRDAGMQLVRNDARNTVRRMISGTLESDQTGRGLENCTPIGVRRVQYRVSTSANAVLSEQERQQQQGTRDEDSLADAYAKTTEQSQLRALTMAAKDSVDAFQVRLRAQKPKTTETVLPPFLPLRYPS